MRKSLLMPVTLVSLSFGVATLALANPLDRAGSIRGQKPAPSRPAAAQPAGPIPDQGVHNAVHAAHQNQIVFTRIDTTVGGITEADIVRDFTLGQPMFFRVYMERSAVNAIAAATGMPASAVYADGVHYTARFTIDGQTFDTTMFPWGNPRDHQTWTTWRGQFINPGTAQRTPGSDAFFEMLSRATSAGLLKPGKHTIKMELIAKTNTEKAGPISAGVVASGTFNLTVPAGIFSPSNTTICGARRGGAGSAAMEARALSEAKRISRNPELVPVRAIGIGESWDVERNAVTGIPIERETYVLIQSRGPKFCTSNTHSFYEDYMGGGSFSTATGSISVNMRVGYVPCGCLP
ncbi:MAG TPA: hypothetical protein VFV30_07340 [Novosphingobium sp.]|nr:hypothetical protein [Novosphingobium sp.]